MIREQDFQITTEPAIVVEPMLGEVICPNMCNNGKVRHYPDSTRALYNMITCPYCKGNGVVTEQQAKHINGML